MQEKEVESSKDGDSESFPPSDSLMAEEEEEEEYPPKRRTRSQRGRAEQKSGGSDKNSSASTISAANDSLNVGESNEGRADTDKNGPENANKKIDPKEGSNDVDEDTEDKEKIVKDGDNVKDSDSDPTGLSKKSTSKKEEKANKKSKNTDEKTAAKEEEMKADVNHLEGKLGSVMAAAAAAASKLFPGGTLGPAEDMDPTMADILTNKVDSKQIRDNFAMTNSIIGFIC